MDFLTLVKENWDKIVALFDKLYFMIKDFFLKQGE